MRDSTCIHCGTAIRFEGDFEGARNKWIHVANDSVWCHIFDEADRNMAEVPVTKLIAPR